MVVIFETMRFVCMFLVVLPLLDIAIMPFKRQQLIMNLDKEKKCLTYCYTTCMWAIS